MEVDSFRYLPPLIKRYYQLSHVRKELPIPFTPLRKPLRECRFGLVTSGGLYHKGREQPFDEERERREPSWGDPGYRTLPVGMDPAEVGVSHLHINRRDVVADMNILLPVQRFEELGVRSQRARAGTSLRGGGDGHRDGDQHALLARARRRAALVGGGVSLRPHPGSGARR
jgi:hypothetical protein